MKTRISKSVQILSALFLLFSLLTAGCSSATPQQQAHSQMHGETPDKLNVGTALKPVLSGYMSQKLTTPQSQTSAQTQALSQTQSASQAQFPFQAQVWSQSQLKAIKSLTNTFGEDPETGRNFTWMTPASVKSGVVEYCEKNRFNGFDKPNATIMTAQSYVTRTDSDIRTIHKAKLKSLKPGTEYVYRVGHDTGGFSPESTFKTAESSLNQYTFINITDTQGGNAKDYAVWKNTLNKALERFPDARFLVHTGDMTDVGQDISQWDMFIKSVQPEIMNLPILPVIGNHDAINKNGTNNNF